MNIRSDRQTTPPPMAHVEPFKAHSYSRTRRFTERFVERIVTATAPNALFSTRGPYGTPRAVQDFVCKLDDNLPKFSSFLFVPNVGTHCDCVDTRELVGKHVVPSCLSAVQDPNTEAVLPRHDMKGFFPFCTPSCFSLFYVCARREPMLCACAPAEC